MRISLAIFAGFLAGILAGCADEASSANRTEKSFENLQRIKAAGKSVTLEASNIEASFTYDFYILEHEVTRGEYAELMGTAVADGEENLPQTNVTFYDAALYANALSKKVKLDTVYSFTGKTFDTDGKVVFCENFSADYSKDGYRLPTEAEWTFAATPGFNPSALGWTSDNSDYRLHDVCTLERDGSGLCDMAGNALEWVGDWMSETSDTSIANFVGGSGPNSRDEIVVKGGSFRNAAANVTLKNQKDVYTVTPSMAADYVGFRLVRGAISNPGSAETTVKPQEYDVKILTSASRLKTAVGTYRAVLAFRDDETSDIAYVNFMSSDPHVIEIADTIDAYHPAVSPDGKRVAFSTRPEGISGKSELYVRNLDANGSGLVKLDVESAAIPRWRVVGADTQIVYVTSASNNSDAAEWKSGATYAVRFSGGKFGEPEKLFDGTYNAGISADGQLAVSGARLLRASVGGKETLWYAGEQACNASLSDSAKRTLFLDFGGTPGVEFAGQSYNAHKMLLVADSGGSLSQMIPSPAGYEFDHTEWVRGSERLAVATLTDDEGAHSKIILLDTRDSSVLELASGAELWHPDLWVGPRRVTDIELDPDSAGVYLKETDEGYSLKARRVRLEVFWENVDSLEIACVGSSHIELGVNPLLMPDFNTVNLGTSSTAFGLTKYIAESYVLNHAEKLKVIAISLDIGIWYNVENFPEGEQFLNEPGAVYDRNHDFWKDGIPEGFVEMVQNSYAVEEIRVGLKPYKGHSAGISGGWGESPEVGVDSNWATKDPTIVPLQMQRLEELIQKASEKDVYLIGIITPQSPKYRETGSFGRYGPQRSVATKIVASLDSLQNVYPNFRLMDENKFGDHDYTDRMAWDSDHLAEPGAVQLTQRLDSLLKTLEPLK